MDIQPGFFGRKFEGKLELTIPEGLAFQLTNASIRANKHASLSVKTSDSEDYVLLCCLNEKCRQWSFSLVFTDDIELLCEGDAAISISGNIEVVNDPMYEEDSEDEFDPMVYEDESEEEEVSGEEMNEESEEENRFELLESEEEKKNEQIKDANQKNNKKKEEKKAQDHETKGESTKKEETSAKKQMTPGKKEATPTKKEATPTKKEATPTKKEAAPTKKEATPAKKEATPAKKEATPAKKENTPNKNKNENKKRPQDSETPSNKKVKTTMNVKGVTIEDLVVGEGRVAKSGNKVSVLYKGRLASNQKQFDACQSRNNPFKFSLGAGEVIRGWDIGIAGMKVGGKRRLTIPAHLGYGARGSPPVIPKNAALIFDVELLKC